MGGAPRSLSFLISNLDKTKFKPIVLLADRPANQTVQKLFESVGAEVVLEKHIRPFDGSTVSPCKSLKMAAYYLAGAIPTLLATRKHVKAIKPDLVHLNSSCLFMAAAGVKGADINIKTIVHIREPLQLNWWGNILAVMNRRFADIYISIDRYGLSTMGAKDESCCFVIPNFVDRDVYKYDSSDRYEIRKQFACGNDDVIFLVLARIAPSNGQRELSEFLANYKHQIPDNARFVVCGFDDQHSEYAIATKAAIAQNNNVFAMRFTSNIVQLINAADVMLAPFITPHNARMVIEGSAMNKPSLVSCMDNLKEQIEPNQTGFLFNFDNPSNLVDKISIFCRDASLLSRMGNAAGAFAAKNFDDKKNVKHIVEIYQRILSPIDDP